MEKLVQADAKFGSDHEHPCIDPQVTTCTLSECQEANECQRFRRAKISLGAPVCKESLPPQEDERTPGPWSVHYGEAVKIKDANDYTIASLSQIHLHGRRSKSEVAKTAAFIVEACNSFNSLREALTNTQALAVDMRKRWRAAENALYQFNYPPDPKMLREVADEIDCGHDCEFGHIEWDTNAHVCSKRDKEGCPGDNAVQLREFADAIEARAALNGVTQPAKPTGIEMTEAQIKHMVDRFLSWKLPESFNPDGGINFEKTFNEHTSYPSKHEPYGTNLFNFDEATAMVRHMLGGLPQPASFKADQLEELLVAAYKRGWAWANENPGDGEFIDKAARDYADYTMHAPGSEAGKLSTDEVKS